jgi:hypothetical protein
VRHVGHLPRIKTLERDVLQQGRPAVGVISQQYSFTAFASLRLNSRKEVFGTRLRNICYGFLKLLTSEIA